MTLKRPISATAQAASEPLKPRSCRYGGRCVVTNAMWKPQTKKPAVSSR